MTATKTAQDTLVEAAAAVADLLDAYMADDASVYPYDVLDAIRDVLVPALEKVR